MQPEIHLARHCYRRTSYKGQEQSLQERSSDISVAICLPLFDWDVTFSGSVFVA